MTEITITLDDPARTVSLLKDTATYCNSDAGVHTHWLAEHIEARIPKPVDEPREFGSIVRATCGPDLIGIMWQYAPARGRHYWASETGTVGVWRDLTDVEVLRVGIGEPSGDAYARGYEDGVESNLPSPIDQSAIRNALQDLG